MPPRANFSSPNQGGVGASAGINMELDRLFEPRIGAAYKVLGSDKTVVRGGFSIYHDSAWSQGRAGPLAESSLFCRGR